MRSDVYHQNLVDFVVDEAHCVVKWYVMYKHHDNTCFYNDNHHISVCDPPPHPPQPPYHPHFLKNMYTIALCTTHPCRGDYFRKEFSKLGEIRSLIPSTTNVMALTATATVDKIIAILGMSKPIIVSESPDKPNLLFQVREKTSISDVFTSLVKQLKEKRVNLPRVIILCQKCE